MGEIIDFNTNNTYENDNTYEVFLEKRDLHYWEIEEGRIRKILRRKFL